MRRLLNVSIVLALFIGLTSVAYFFRVPLLTRLGASVIREDRPVPSDIIVILNGMYPRDVVEAADLYRERLAPKVIMVRERWFPGFLELRRRLPDTMDQTDWKRHVLVKLGVPSSSVVVLEPKVESTRQEAEAVARYVREHRDVKKVIVVARFPQTERAAELFERLLGPMISVYVVASKQEEIRADNWWLDRWHLREMVQEYFTRAYQRLGGSGI